jgi:predicted ATPase
MRSFGKVMQDVLSAKNDIDARADKISSAKDANTTRKNDDKLISSADFSYTPTSDKFKEFLHNLLYVRMIDDEIAMPNDTLGRFVIFSPEHSQLRQFDQEGQIEPLGINGQGLLKLLQFMSEESADTLTPITKGLRLLGWFKDFAVVFDKLHGRLEISDRFLAPGLKYADQRSANEGFLFLLFYFTLFSSDLTPNFFGVDNLDTSLNPKLCQRLLIELVELSKDHDKQTLITTHNPAILDGLNLDDDAQRLFVLYRGDHGQSMVRRIKKPETTGAPIRLSEAFLRGALGGLPKSF